MPTEQTLQQERSMNPKWWNHGDLSPFVSHASWLTKFLYFSQVICSWSMILVAILTSCTITSQVSCVLDQKKSSQIQEGNLQTSRHFRSFIVQYNPQLFTPGFYNPKASIRMPRQKWFQILNRKWRRRTPKRSNARRMRCARLGLSCEMLA